jgi:hypothetical protein
VTQKGSQEAPHDDTAVCSMRNEGIACNHPVPPVSSFVDLNESQLH